MNTPLATLALGGIFSATKKPKDEVDIPDPNLKTALRNALCLSDSEPLTKEGLAGLTSLYEDFLHILFWGHPQINDLTGLEYCTGLRSLTLCGPINKDITPLSALVNLRELTLQMIPCSPAPLLSLINLRSLTLEYPLTDEYMELGTLPCLRELVIHGCGDGDISPLQAFKNLVCLKIIQGPLGNNEVSHDLTSLESLTKLRNLYLGERGITDVTPLKTLTNLQILQLQENQITDISPLNALGQLKELDLNKNQITDIRPLKKLARLKTLNLSHNQITDVAPLQSLNKLKWLRLDSNLIKDISPLKNLKGLSGVNLSNNPIADSMISETIAEMKGLEAAERRGRCLRMDRTYPRNDFLKKEEVNGTSSF